jgi:hypothetical protein
MNYSSNWKYYHKERREVKMINNNEAENEITHYLPKCPKYPPQRTRFTALDRLSLTRHPIILLLVLSILSSIFLRIPPAVPNPVSSNLETGTTGSAVSSSNELADLVYTAEGGFALAITASFDVTGDQDILLVKTDMNGLVQWSKTFGRQFSHDVASALVQTSDGGYALVGLTSDGLWLIKTDAEGNVEWNKTFGGSVANEIIYGYDYVAGIAGIVQTQEGDYILTMELATEGEGDQFLVKIDRVGTIIWRSQKLPESILTSAQTQDGGLALAGYTWEYGKPSDIILVKTDRNGEENWSQTIGGLGNDVAQSLVQTADGGFALSGWYGSDEPSASMKWLLMKTDSNGVMRWRQTYHKRDWGEKIVLVQTTDGGFALAGINQDDPHPGFVSLVKTNNNGDLEWSQTYSDLPGDFMYASWEGYSYHDLFLVQTIDKGFALAGILNDDVYLMKLAENGTKEWKRFFDGTIDEDWATDLIQTVDGGFVFTGYVGSQVGLVKTDESGVLIWNHTYGGSKDDEPKVVIQTVDGGFVIVGSTRSQGADNSEAWLIKTDENGLVEWTQTYGGMEDDGAEAIIQTADEGFALAGFTHSHGAGNSDAWLIKTDKNGIPEWNQSYGGELDDKVLHLYQLSNGNFALLGYYGQYLVTGYNHWTGCEEAEIYDDAWLLITDENGLLHQEFVYELPEDIQFHDLSWSIEDGIRISGTFADEAGQDTMFLLKGNGSGVFQWNKTLTHLEHTRYWAQGIDEYWRDSLYPRPLVDLIFTTDGGLILSGGFIDDTSPPYYHQSLMKMDSNGSIQWIANLTVSNIADISIIQLPDGGYALAGGVFSHGPNGDSVDAWLARIDENGIMLWQQTYGTSGGKISYYSEEGHPSAKTSYYTEEGELSAVPTSFSSWFMIIGMIFVVTGIRSNKKTLRSKNKPK